MVMDVAVDVPSALPLFVGELDNVRHVICLLRAVQPATAAKSTRAAMAATRRDATSDWPAPAHLGDLTAEPGAFATSTQTALLVCSERGIKVIVEAGGVFQAAGYVDSHLFQRYEVRRSADEASQTPAAAAATQGRAMVRFRVHLGSLVECLQIFGSNTENFARPLTPGLNSNGHFANSSSCLCRLEYEGLGHPLRVLLQDNGQISDCRLKTFHVGAMPGQDFTNPQFDLHLGPEGVTPKINIIIMQSEAIKDLFGDFDAYAGDYVVISFQTDQLALETDSSYGKFKVSLSATSELVELYECPMKTCRYSYRMSVLRYVLKALSNVGQSCRKLSLRVNSLGLVCMQLMLMPTTGGGSALCHSTIDPALQKPSYAEFYLLPMDKLYLDIDDLDN